MTVHWSLPSGIFYDYDVYPIDSILAHVPGNYIYAKQNQNGSFTAMYVGETENLADCPTDHENLPLALENGATHILIRISSSDIKVRRAERDELIAHLKPVCN